MKHIVCFSGGESSAVVAVEVVRRFGAENVVLLNHNINSNYEAPDIKRFKAEVANYLGMQICYANIQDITDPEKIPDQFEVCVKAGALTDFKTQQALCTSRLKTEPFMNYLKQNFYTNEEISKECIIYYGFDRRELVRIRRRVGIMAAIGYKTDYPLATWKGRTIWKIEEINIKPSITYSLFEHANCKGCLKASLLHWYVIYCFYPKIYRKGVWMERNISFTIHTIVRNGIKEPISLTELKVFFERMKNNGVLATEHQSKLKFANVLRLYQLEECSIAKPCECVI
jgi:hypothetical protein